MRKKYEEMTVAELRAETKERGLVQQKGGKKFVKAELIKQLVEDDGWYGEEEEWLADPEEDVTERGKQKKRSAERETFAENFVQIVKKYGYRRSKKTYNRMNLGDIVVFVHSVDAKDGNTYRKIRTAKIVELNRSSEVVTVETLFGDRVQLFFEDILYIRFDGERLPLDIRKYMSMKRSDFGKASVKEKLGYE